MTQVYNDIENGINSNNVENTKIVNNVKIVVLIIFTLLSFPLIFCDLYFAVNDKTCVYQTFDKLAVNMYDYLIVNAIYNIFMLFILFVYIIAIDIEKDNACLILFIHIIGFINKIFITSWTIIGGVIFWHFMNNNDCSFTVYNYLFASLIIKLVFVSIGNMQQSDNKK
jgi:hypothetical protein